MQNVMPALLRLCRSPIVHVGNVSFYAARALFCLNANAAAGKWCNIRVNPAARRSPSLPLLISLVVMLLGTSIYVETRDRKVLRRS
jgi:hypothetical protein